MKPLMKVSSSELLINRSVFSESWREPTSVPYRYAFETGFHVYGKLNLKLDLSAADDKKQAQRYLRVIQAYAVIADECARIQGALLLEVQGEVIHLLLPGEHEVQTIDRLLSFCATFLQIVYAELQPLADDDWNSFVMATDHGKAVMIESGNGDSDSVVSLGPAANQPAKLISKTTAGCLSIRSSTLGMVYDNVDRKKEWVEFDLRNPPYVPQVRKYSNDQAFIVNTAAMRSAAAESLKKYAFLEPDIRLITETELRVNTEPDIITPLQVQGFYMRADINGFTDDVQEAFNKGPEAVKVLVERFTTLMGFAEAFARSRRRIVIKLPWAGDCANMIMLTGQGRSYDYDRASVPATESADWHGLSGEKDTFGRGWRDLFLKSDWAVAVAGGDKEKEGNDGFLLVASIQTRNRRFKIAAGWGARRSLDALDATGIGKRDTVVHEVDYSALSENFQQHFSRVDSNFYKAHDLDKKKLNEAAILAESKTCSVAVPNSNIVIPPAKPHYT